MKNNRSSLTPGRLKKPLDALTSVLGSIKAYFPDTEADLLQSLKAHNPDLYDLAVERGVITASLAQRAVPPPVVDKIQKARPRSEIMGFGGGGITKM